MNVKEYMKKLKEELLSGAIFDEANLSSAIWVDGKKCALGSIGTCN